MLYASYTILLGRLRTCCVGSEKINGKSVWCRFVLCSRCQPQSTASFCSTVLFPVAGISCQPGIFLPQTSSWWERSGILAQPVQCHSLTGCCPHWWTAQPVELVYWAPLLAETVLTTIPHLRFQISVRYQESSKEFFAALHSMQQEVRQPVVLKPLHRLGRGTGRCWGPWVSS